MQPYRVFGTTEPKCTMSKSPLISEDFNLDRALGDMFVVSGRNSAVKSKTLGNKKACHHKGSSATERRQAKAENKKGGVPATGEPSTGGESSLQSDGVPGWFLEVVKPTVSMAGEAGLSMPP